MSESIGEMIIPGTYIEVRAEGLIGVGGIPTGNIGVVGTANRGPVDQVVILGSYAEALELVNSHVYGNGVSIFTREGDAARDFVQRVQAGMVGVNIPIPVPLAFHSFGGWKQSLFGDHHIYGPEGIRFYTRLKTVTTRWPDDIHEGAIFTFPSMK